MIEDPEWNLKEEIKRADHLIYVSMKYTRTCDVMKNVIKRLINAFDYGFLDILKKLKNKNIPKSPIAKVVLCEKLLKKELKDYIKLYYLLKRIDKAEFGRREEYRKNVTLIIKDKKPLEINTEVLKGYFEATKEFVRFVEAL